LLERGGPADLAVWSGDPFEATSRLLLVVAGGEVVWPEGMEERGEEREAQ
jgi:imidazolonepropionase-like amidohydrolase